MKKGGWERWNMTGISRRELLKAGAAGVAAMGLAKIPYEALAADEKVLIVQTWGGAIRDTMRKSMFEPFSKKTGIKIVTADATGSIMPQIKAQVQSKNVEWDVASGMGMANIIHLSKENLLEPIDYSIVKKQDVFEDGMHPYGVGCWVISDNLVYNTKKFPPGKQPKNWAEFWDVKKFPGPRSLTSIPATAVMDNLAFALLADGVPKDKIYPYDLDRAYKKLDEIKPHMKAWWSSGAHWQQIFTDQEVWLGSGWNGRVMTIQKQGAPVDFVWEGGRLTYNYFVVVKNAPHKKAAMEFIDFATRAEAQAEMTKQIFYGPVNKKCFDFLPQDLIKSLNTYPPNKEKHYLPDEAWLGEHELKLMEQWQRWITR